MIANPIFQCLGFVCREQLPCLEVLFFHDKNRCLSILSALLTGVFAIGCAGTTEPPVAGFAMGVIPDLRGQRVMVFPVQTQPGVPGDASPEIVFALRNGSADVGWVFPDELEAALARAPGIEGRIRNLAVGNFLSGEVERIGDPLYGELRRMGGLVNSEIAFIPVMVRPGVDEVTGVTTVEIVATLLNVRTGRLIWFGIVGGRPGSLADFGSVASAVEELAETLLPYR